MGQDDKPRHVPAVSSLPPATEEIDTNWDDEPIADGDDPSPSPFDRPTIAPDYNLASLAARMMEIDEPTSDPPLADPLTPPRVPVFRADGLPDLPSEPPPGPRGRGRAPSLPATSLPTTGTPHEETLRDWPSPESFEAPHVEQPRAKAERARTSPEGPRYVYGRGGVFDRATGLELADDDDLSRRKAGPLEGEADLSLGRSDPTDFGALTRPTPRESVRTGLMQTPHAATSSEPPTPRASAPAKARVEDDAGPIADMKDRYAVGDFTGALVIAESVLETQPDHAEAKRYAQSCREVLTQMYAARLGSLSQVATVAIPADQIRWLSLDHRAGFLLSLVDGLCTIEEILDVSGMSRLDALRIMFTLVQQRVISLESASR